MGARKSSAEQEAAVSPSPRAASKVPPGLRKPGRPRKDGLPPIQWKKGEVGEIDPITGEPVAPPPEFEVLVGSRDPRLIARIRYLAGRGLQPDNISALTSVPAEAFIQGGVYFEDVRVGRAEANLEIMEALFEKALAKNDKSYVEKLFLAKSLVGLAETPAGRAKVAAEQGGDEDITEIEIEVVETEPRLRAIQGGAPQAHQKSAAGGKKRSGS